MEPVYKSSQESQVIITELTTPDKANFGGKIHGGYLLSLLDKVAYVCASKHAEQYCVTVSVDTVEFLHPIEVGELLHFYASINYVGSTSMIIGIKVVAENIKTKSVRHTNTSYFTMVAINESGHPQQVPGLLINNKTELRRFVEGKARKTANKTFREQFNEQKQSLQEQFLGENLSNENCKLGF